MGTLYWSNVEQRFARCGQPFFAAVAGALAGTGNLAGQPADEQVQTISKVEAIPGSLNQHDGNAD